MSIPSEPSPSIETSLHKLLTDALQPDYLQITNDSHLHQGPALESHFKVLVVSNQFADLSAVKRHQKVYKILKAERIMEKIHALQLTTWTYPEWQQNPLAEKPSSKCAQSS